MNKVYLYRYDPEQTMEVVRIVSHFQDICFSEAREYLKTLPQILVQKWEEKKADELVEKLTSLNCHAKSVVNNDKLYEAKIPTPSAKRLEKNRMLVVECSNGFGQSRSEWDIPEGENMVMWEYEYFKPEYPTAFIDDGEIHYSTFIEYSNATGTRTEKIKIDPEEI